MFPKTASIDTSRARMAEGLKHTETRKRVVEDTRDQSLENCLIGLS